MQKAVEALTATAHGSVAARDTITASNLWLAVQPMAALIGTLVVVGFAIYLFRKVVKRAARGKGGF